MNCIEEKKKETDNSMSKMNKELNINPGTTKFSVKVIQKKVDEYNNKIGFNAIKFEKESDFVGIILPNDTGILNRIKKLVDFQEEINKIKADQSKPLEDGDSENIMNQTLPDLERVRIDQRLESFLKKMLKKMGVTVENLDEYKARYKAKTGKDISAIALADIYKNIIAIAENNRDGTTLAEEAFHFITDMYWDHPMFQDILNLRTDGVNFDYTQSEIYRNHYQPYLKDYNNDELKATKEIIGKLLARTMYDQMQKDSITYKIKSILEKLLQFFMLKRLFPSIRLNKEITINGITKELNEILQKNVAEIKSDTFQSGLTARVEGDGTLVIPHSDFSENAARTLLTHLKAQKSRAEQKKIGLYDKILKESYKKLSAKFSGKTLQNLRDELELLKGKTNLTPVDEVLLNDISELLTLTKLDALDTLNEKKLKNINARLESLSIQIAKHNFEGGIHLFFYGPNGTDGAFRDIIKIQEFIGKLKGEIPTASGEVLELDLETYGQMQESLNLYVPVINELNKLYEGGFSFTELTPESNLELKASLKKQFYETIPSIENYLKSRASDMIRGIMKGELGENKALKTRLNDTVIKLFNSNIWQYAFGAAQNSKEDILGIYHRELVKSLDKIHVKTNNEARDLYNKISTKKYDTKTFVERDANGNKTGYWLSEYQIQESEKDRDLQRDIIIKQIEKVSRDAGYNIKIPTDRELRHEMFSSDLYYAKTPKEIHLKKLNDLYKKLWADYFGKNRMRHPDYLNIIQNRKDSLNSTQFKIWESKNIKVGKLYSEGELLEYTYYTGELSVPSDGSAQENPFGKSVKTKDWRNPKYDKLKSSNPESFEVLNILKDQHVKAKLALPIGLSYESINRLPQMSQSWLDTIIRGGKGITDNITDLVVDKADDPLHGDRSNLGELLDRPKINYISKLENPNIITDDIFRSVVMFTEMSNNYTEFMNRLPYFNGIIEVVRKSDRHSGKRGVTGYIKEEIFNSAPSTEDYLLKRFEHLKKTIIQGENINKEESLQGITKLLSFIKNYLTKKDLLGNAPSIAVGYISGKIENAIETMLGNFNTKESNIFSKKELVKNSGGLLKDFATPNKLNKISLMAQDMSLIDDIADVYSDTNKNRAIRAIAMTVDYGGWRFADMNLKYEAMIATADNLRFIDGNFYTKASWEEHVKENPTASLETFKTAPTYYDGVTVDKDGKLIYAEYITKTSIDFFKRRTKTFGSRLDSQPLNSDKAAIYTNRFGQMLTIHMGWLFQMVERGFKDKHYNYMTSEEEMGWWKAFWNVVMVHPSQWHNIVINYKNASKVEQDGIKRIGMMTAASSLLFAAAYILGAMALGDDDDENPELQYAAYLTTRALMEQEARISFTDLFNFIKSPLAGVDKISGIWQIITLPFTFFKDEDIVEKGMYKEHSEEFKKTIQSIPLIKGWFETMYGGWYNEVSGKGSTSIATSIKGKNQFVTNTVINDEDKTFLRWFGVFTRPLAKFTLGYPLAQSFSSYPESKSAWALPDKKSNKKD